MDRTALLLGFSSSLALESFNSYEFYQIHADPGEVIQEFSSYSFPRLDELYRYKEKPEKITACIAFDEEDKIAATAIGEISRDGKTLSILSVWVSPGAQGKGVLWKALQYLEKGAQYKGCMFIEARFRSYWPTAPLLNYLLDTLHYPPQIEGHRFFTVPRVSDFAKLPWYKTTLKKTLPSGYSVEFFHPGIVQELHRLMSKKKAEIPQAYHPLQLLDKLNYDYSLILRKEEAIFGWMTAHSLRKDIVQITALFTFETVPSGLGLYLIAKSLEKAILRGMSKKIIFMAEDSNRGMKKLLNAIVPETTEISAQILRVKKLEK